MNFDWLPSGDLTLLKSRAQLLAAIRQFFSERGVLEVETPLLSQGIGTDPQLAFFTTDYQLYPRRQTMYLQTSPEFAMKRLLAAGSGSIYQICKAFRNGETGRLHNPEFTLLEWYRVGFDLFDLMDEVEELVNAVFLPYRSLTCTHRVSYQSVFMQHTGLDALRFSLTDYSSYAEKTGLAEAITICGTSHALWLDFIFSHCVQPKLNDNALYLVYGYPACQSSLARLNAQNPEITDRVEVFIDGVELGNGYYELTDAREQDERFDREIAIRRLQGLPDVTKDVRLLQALESGLPDCAGIAIGLDRLLMRMTQSSSIDQVLAFPVAKA
ncbi:MAG: EF-P lysine aminoacylase GenX [Methylomicrobium sp.]|nr:EF-P lysine aminoacylase GenX [Methylomicrobium sp.]